MKRIENFELCADTECNFSNIPQNHAEQFFRPIYRMFYGELPENGGLMTLDADAFRERIVRLYGNLSNDVQNRLRNNAGVGKADFQKNPYQKILWIFLSVFPQFGLVLKHINLNADLSLKAAALLIGQEVSAENFIHFKQETDRLNRLAWTREQTTQESQSGVSNLGTVSETLLEKAFSDLIDGEKFFKTTNQEIQSYGDFVLMCLPNNLWISVKSNYARERLLASGYTTDILGVGFFTDYKEFTSKAKIRNFQRVGFLAMYLPDIPISEIQQQNVSNTYGEVCTFYTEHGREMPKNINGTEFLRPLSQLCGDISSLLQETDVRNRTTLKF